MHKSVAGDVHAVIKTVLHGADPLPWLLSSDEPYARWAALTAVLGRPDDDPEVHAAREATLSDPRVTALKSELPDPTDPGYSDHHSPKFMPNHLNLLADMGVRSGDSPRVDALIDSLLMTRDNQGRFRTPEIAGRRRKPERGSLLCDTNVITDTILRFGRGGERHIIRSLRRMTEDLANTPQGPGWRCVPERRPVLRPNRIVDACPQVTLEGLRAWSHAPPDARPARVLEAARTPLEIWRRRTEERPYSFGHGYQFKSVKWPNFWYDVLWVLETVGRYPYLWRGDSVREEDRQALAELAACLIAYNFDDEGRVTPRRIYRGFERFSFGAKRAPSPFATARALAALARLGDLADQIASVDVSRLPSSKGGSGMAMPPRGQRGEPAYCPVPPQARTYRAVRATARVLTRHHLTGRQWRDHDSIESVVSDIVGLHAGEPTSPYLSLLARQPDMTRDSLDSALFDRKTLVLFRCMRGTVYAVRREMLPVVHAATTRAVVRHARAFALARGVTPEVYEASASRILDLLAEEPLTTNELRGRLGGTVNIAALITLLSAEGSLLRDRPRGGWQDRRYTYVPLSKALPDVSLDSITGDNALIELMRQYVRAFGPVTKRDAAWWSGVGVTRVKWALRHLEDEIVEVSLDDSEEIHLMHATDTDELTSATLMEGPEVSFLPSFDPLTMGYAERGRYVADEHRPFVFDRSGNVTSVVLVNGKVIGVWDIAEKDSPTVIVTLFQEADAGVREAIERRAGELGRFWFGEDALLEYRESMTPLCERPAGGVRRPLR